MSRVSYPDRLQRNNVSLMIHVVQIIDDTAYCAWGLIVLIDWYQSLSR